MMAKLLILRVHGGVYARDVTNYSIFLPNADSASSTAKEASGPESAVDLTAMADLQNQYCQALAFNLADGAIVTDAIPP